MVTAGLAARKQREREVVRGPAPPGTTATPLGTGLPTPVHALRAPDMERTKAEPMEELGRGVAAVKLKAGALRIDVGRAMATVSA